MTPEQEFENTLYICLQAIEQGQATIEQCLERYPALLGLRELLDATQSVRELPHPALDPYYMDALERKLTTKMAANRQPYRLPTWSRVALAAAACLLLFFIVTGGMVQASASALPGDALYGIKRNVEQIRLAFATTTTRPAVLVAIAENRMNEVTALIQRKQAVTPEFFNEVTTSLANALAAEPDPSLHAALYAQGLDVLKTLSASGNTSSGIASLGIALEGVVTATPTSEPTQTMTPLPTQSDLTESADTVVRPTRVFAPTPTETFAASGPSVLRVQYVSGNAYPSGYELRPQFRIVNPDSTSIPLSELRIRYWFTRDTPMPLAFLCVYAPIGCPNILGHFVYLSSPFVGADSYLEISFTSGAGNIPAQGSSGEIQTFNYKTDWSNFNESDDYSYLPKQAGYVDNPNITMYRNGALIWGVEPSIPMIPSPTPTVTANPMTLTAMPNATVAPNSTGGNPANSTGNGSSNATATLSPQAAALQSQLSCVIDQQMVKVLQQKLSQNDINGFVGQVKAQSGKKIATDCANQLLASVGGG